MGGGDGSTDHDLTKIRLVNKRFIKNVGTMMCLMMFIL